MNYKYLEEKAKQLGKQLLIENVRVSINPKNIEIFDKPILVESSNGNKYTARAIIRNVPSSKFTENLNGRIYSRQLDEKIIKEGVAEGTLSLVDHPSDEGSIGNICGVWHNPHMDENYSYADWYLTGSKGQDILEHIMAGATQIGISRVGFGNFKEDNKTVDPEDYMLERWGDCVLNPSQEVFATLEQTIELPEATNSSSLFSESNTNKYDSKLIENSDRKQLEERYTMLKDSSNIKNNVRVILKEAKSNKKSIKEAIDDIKFWQAETPLEEKELHIYINSSLMELSEKMEQDISMTEKSLKEKEISLEELKAKYASAEKMIAELTERYNKAKALVEKGDAGDVKVLKENESKMKSDISKLVKERVLMETDIKCLLSDTKAMKSDISILMKEKKDMLSDISVYDRKLREAEKHIKGLEKILEDDYGYAFDDEGSEEVIKAEDLNPEDVIIDGDVYEPKEDDVIDDISMDEPMMDETDTFDSYAEQYHSKFKEEDKKDDEDDSKKDDDDKKDSKKDDEDDKKDDDKKDDKKEESIPRLKNKIDESVKVLPAVAQLFNEALKENKSLNDVKKQILESKSVLEASKKIQKFTEIRGNDFMSVSSHTKNNDTITYRFNR